MGQIFVQADSENIWKLNRYDLVLEYWGKTPLSCTPFMIVEHVLLLLKMCCFHRKGAMRQNQIVCWARSPGDHAMHITQFPIRNFNWFGEELDPGTTKADEDDDDTPKRDFDDVINELIEFEENMIKVRIKPAHAPINNYFSGRGGG